jgi:Fe-S oxidoreductase
MIAELPRIAPFAWRFGGLAALRDAWKPAAVLSENLFGFARDRTLPRFSSAPFRDREAVNQGAGSGRIVLFSDTFGRWFEPETLRAAVKVLTAAGYGLEPAMPSDGTSRPLCCGRTYLAAGMIDRARKEAERTLSALIPAIADGATVVGLEPSCILTLRDEFLSLIPGEDARLLSRHAMLVEEFLAGEAEAGRLKLDLSATARKALLHGHCHQKAFGVMGAVERTLSLIPGLQVETVDASCCGMAGPFGFDAETVAISKAMGEISLLPAIRAAEPDTLIVADGTSCRHQIADCSLRRARHVVEVLADALHDADRQNGEITARNAEQGSG